MIEIEGPEGTIYEFPAGTDDATIARAMQQVYGAPAAPSGAGMTPQPLQPMLEPQMPPQAAPERGLGAMLYDNLIGNPDDGVDSYGEQFGTWLGRAVDTGTLGLVGDEANAAVSGMFPGRSYEGELDRYRQNEADMSMPGRLSADLFGAIAPALTGAGMVSTARTLPAAMGRGAALGAGAGATQGFMEGEGGFGNRAMSAGLGGTFGGIVGGAVPAVAEVGRHAARAVGDMRRGGRIGSTVGEALGVDDTTGRVLAEALGADDPRVMREALGRAGPGAMLADASPQAAGTLDYAMRTPVPGARLAAERVTDRAGGAYDDIMDALRANQQGPVMPFRARAGEMARRTRGAISEQYQRAYDTPIDYASDAGRRIEDLLRRLPQGTAARAINDATDRMIYDGLPNPQLMVSIADDGSMSFTALPNVMQLDYIKRAFDDIAESGVDAVTGRASPDSAFARRIARDIRDATREAVPAYGEALESAATAIQERGAHRVGAVALRPQTTVEDVLDAVDGATGPELAAMRDGVRSQIEHVLGNVRAVATDQNIEPRQAMQALREMSSPNAQRKLEAIFGNQWPDIQRAIQEGSVALGLRARTATGSQTAGRQFADQALQEATGPGAFRRGEPVQALRNLIGGVTGASPDAVSRLRADTRSQLADVLSQQGGTADRALQSIVEALAANPQDPQAGAIVRELLRAAGFGLIPAGVGTGTGMMN